MKKVLIIFFVVLFSCESRHSQDENITLVSWNIRGFGSKDSTALEEVANLIKIADIVAIQEVSVEDGPDKLAALLGFLNKDEELWAGSFSEETESTSSHKERFAYLWKTSQIQVRSEGTLVKSLQDRIQREPFLMEFENNNKTVQLLNVHVRSESSTLIDQELEGLNDYLIDKGANSMIVLGDFNADEDNQTLKKIISDKFSVALIDENTTLKNKCDQGEYLSKATDNILYSEKIQIFNSGAIDNIGACPGLKRASELSDHLPIFIQFSIK